jgi:hypothetical protein
MTIHVARSNGAHVAESDAQWIREQLNDRPRGLPSITDGITGAEAEASAMFDMTIGEIRALKTERDAATARAEQAEAEVAELRERLGLREEWGVLFRLPDGCTDAEGELDDEAAAHRCAERARRGLRDGVTADAACRQVTEWRVVEGGGDE